MTNVITRSIDRSNFDPTWTDSHGEKMGDPWGSAMGLMFDLCAFLYAETEYMPPARWEYSPGANPSAEVDEMQEYNPALYDAMREADINTLLHTGEVLHRYLNFLERNGHAY